MSLLTPALLLAAAFLCGAASSSSSTATEAIAHDSNVDGVLQNLQATQQRHVTSLFSKKAAIRSRDTQTALQQLKLGRNLLNLEKQQQQQQQHEQQQKQQQHQNAKGNKDNGDKDSFVAVHSSSSVVEDRSLVCKQLCGASLGGQPCAAECATDTSDKTTNAKKSQNTKQQQQQQQQQQILVENKSIHKNFELSRAAICADLCGVGLAGKICNCSTAPRKRHTKIETENLHIVCSSYCGGNADPNLIQRDCSTCKKKNIIHNSKNMVKTYSKADRLMQPEAVVPIERTTETTTTPNWNELCAALCKTGDGGSLCNCDLSPFF